VSVDDRRSRNAADGRKPRADARRNRERLIAAAKSGFAESGPQVSLEEIARRAGVGIGTLYRHFPTRDALIGAVYRQEVEQLGDAAETLLRTEPPGEALRRWMWLFVDYVATKRLVAAALGATSGGSPALYANAGERIGTALTALVARARAAGDIRDDADPADLFRALLGFTYGNADPAWQASARRLIDLLMDGLRPVGG
jgi:AcrR family transcriptional regulator